MCVCVCVCVCVFVCVYVCVCEVEGVGLKLKANFQEMVSSLILFLEESRLVKMWIEAVLNINTQETLYYDAYMCSTVFESIFILYNSKI